jgi:hypothetical protein
MWGQIRKVWPCRFEESGLIVVPYSCDYITGLSLENGKSIQIKGIMANSKGFHSTRLKSDPKHRGENIAKN